MNSDSETLKKYQCSTEFGLYRYYDCDDKSDYSNTSKKKSGFSFGYFIILMTAIIVLSSICLVLYNYFSESKSILLKPFCLSPNNTNTTYELSNDTFPIESKEYEDILPEASELNNRHQVIQAERRKITTDQKIPRPFIYEIRDPIPSGFRSPINNNQLEQGQSQVHQTKANNIQDIIKHLTEQQPVNDIKNKRNLRRPMGAFSMKYGSRRKPNPFSYIADPFFPFKPQNPSDINLLATNGVRFAPTVQIEPQKPQQDTETYPKYERPEVINKNVKKKLPASIHATIPNLNVKQNFRNPYFGYQNYGYNLNNQNQYFNQVGRFQQPNWRQQYWNRQRYNNQLLNNQNKNRNGVINPNQMVVHLNLYPKKKRKFPKNDITPSETIVYHNNCTDEDHGSPDYDDKITQIKNTSEFNQLLQTVRHSYLDNFPTKDDQNLFRINNTFFHLNNDEQAKVDDFKYLPNGNGSRNPQNVEVVKSIGFTVLNPNFSKPEMIQDYQYETDQSQWRPITVNIDNFPDNQKINERNFKKDKEDLNLDVEELTENYDYTNGETATLPVPLDIFQKYFNRKSTLKRNQEWDKKILDENPNLVNHRSYFSDKSDE